MSKKPSKPGAQKESAEQPGKKSLIEKVEAWALGQGYPLELQVGQAFRDAGWAVEHVGFYRDLQTRKPRQIDVRAYRRAELEGDQRIILSLSLVIECKVSRKRPWVVFSAPFDDPVPDSSIYTPGIVGSAALDHAIDHVRDDDLFSLMKLNGRLGHGIVSANVNGNELDREKKEPDFAYNALQSAIDGAAALAMLTDVAMWPNEESIRLEAQFWRTAEIDIVFPVVIVDGVLLEIFLSQRGDTVCKEIVEAKLLAGSKDAVAGRQMVTVMTPYNLPSFVQNVTDDFERLSNTLNPLGRRIIGSATKEKQARERFSRHGASSTT